MMKRNLAWISLAAALAWTACGDDEDDGGGGAADAAPTVDAAPAADAAPELDAGLTAEQARGRYLVDHVIACGGCHTPRNEDGSPDLTRYLAGDPSFFDIDPKDENAGNLPVPNLTSHATGLADWTDEEIESALRDGTGKDDDVLFPVMPYYVLHNMTDDDAAAIVAYLRTVPPVDHEIDDPQPPFSLFDTPAAPFPVASIPDTTLPDTDDDYEAAQAGRYLAGFVGVCMECHTARTDPNDPSSLDTAALFAGGEEFPIGGPFGVVESANVTPHATGISGWTAQQVRTALKQGLDIEGDALCPPMPAGPMGAFGGLTDEDALNIGIYLTTLAPIANATTDCTPPSMILAAPAPCRSGASPPAALARPGLR